MAKDTFWFKHDCSASRDPKILEMKSIHGFEGYGLFWAILEVLREQDGYKFKVSEKYKFKPLSGLLMYDQEKLEIFIMDLVNEFELLKYEGGFLYSESLINRMKKWDAAKENGRKGGRPKTQPKPKPKPDAKPKDKPEEKPDEKPQEKRREEKNREEDIREENKNADTPLHAHAPEISNELFEKFWDKYKNKVKRAEAEREWCIAIKKADPNQIISSAIKYWAYCKAKNQIQMNPGNWLKEERWTDEYQIAKPRESAGFSSSVSIPTYENE